MSKELQELREAVERFRAAVGWPPLAQEAEEEAQIWEGIQRRYEHYAAIDARRKAKHQQGDPLTRAYAEDVGFLLSIVAGDGRTR